MVRISFIGDISLNDNYIKLRNQGINPFESLRHILFSSDFVVGNLECMVKGNQGVNEKKRPRLETKIETLNYLKNINLSLAGLANNHIYDHLEDGFYRTTNFLKENKIAFIGASLKNDEYKNPAYFEKDGIKVVILNYVSLDTNPYPPKEINIRVNYFKEEKVIEDIKRLRNKVDHIILYLHWGGRLEGGLYPDFEQPKIGRRLIDAGADLIIGHHSHTVQPFEIYKGKYIFYSLGNFCFSDYWFDGEFYPMSKRRKITNVVDVQFTKDNYNIKTHYFTNNSDSYQLNELYRKRVIIRNHVYKIFLKNKLGWSAYYFNYRFILPILSFFGRNDISFKVKVTRFIKYLRKNLF